MIPSWTAPDEPPFPEEFLSHIRGVALELIADGKDSGNQFFGMMVGNRVCQRHPEVADWIRRNYPGTNDPCQLISMEGMNRDWWWKYTDGLGRTPTPREPPFEST